MIFSDYPTTLVSSLLSAYYGITESLHRMDFFSQYITNLNWIKYLAFKIQSRLSENSTFGKHSLAYCDLVYYINERAQAILPLLQHCFSEFEQAFLNYSKVFFPQNFLKNILKIKRKNVVFSVAISHYKNRIVFY